MLTLSLSLLTQPNRHINLHFLLRPRFRLFLLSPESTHHSHSQRLEQLRFVPDFLAYLAHVLIFQQQEQDSHRAVAGLLLKNSLTAREGPLKGEDDQQAIALNYVRTSILGGLQDKDQMIRQTVAAVVVALLGCEESGGWPEAMDALTKGMAAQDTGVVEVSLVDRRMSIGVSQRGTRIVVWMDILDTVYMGALLTSRPSSTPSRRSAKTSPTSSTLKSKAATFSITSYQNSSNSQPTLPVKSVYTLSTHSSSLHHFVTPKSTPTSIPTSKLFSPGHQTKTQM
jgi:hypothetical protein